ncbi:transporter substrate-binding domain-containing protein [Sinorhizobium meliloti]|uniref:transporter substrate-binding domain-containing protein n=1 Tax=Rhizobium meliloti TaxID=382 RepID=UPI0018659698|nr:transporter substrate-binding domain-containing protein [Sinorhizobium meliloti]
MMGVQFSQQFLIAFVVGLFFIVYFAWDRFNSKSSNPNFRYRVMAQVNVADLGGTGALRRAYLIYLSTMLFLYVAMTFFGKLIVQTLNELRIVGIQVDASSLQFDSPLWPLTLAFGIAGLAPLIPQLRIAEDWLFQRAYRVVGIPVRIHETTRNLVSLLDAAAAGKLSKVQHLVEDLTKNKNDIRTHQSWSSEIVTSAKIDNGLNMLAQLELLLQWAKGRRGNWPGSEVSEAVRDIEQKLIREADDLLDRFQRRVREEASQGDGKAARRAEYVAETVGKARELRDELTAILAVYVERDPSNQERFDNAEAVVRDPSLRELLKQVDPPNLAGTGPELGVLICILFTIPLYAVFTWRGLHFPLTSLASADSLRVVLGTAGLHALLLTSIFWFPLLVAFAVRQYYYDEGKWIARANHEPSTYAEQRLAVVGVAFFISVSCLAGVGALWAFFIARDVISFQAILVGGVSPFLLYYPSYALVTIPLIWLTLIAVDTRVEGRRTFGYGVLSALLVLSGLASHLAFWSSGSACTQYAAFLTDLFTGGCFSYYGGLNFMVMPVLAFLAAVVFGNPHPASFALRRSRLSQRSRAQMAQVLAIAVLISTLTPEALAQEMPDNEEINTANKEPVTIGFRADVEPFSYKVSVDGGTRTGNQPVFSGFLADLCYWIFEGGDFSVTAVEVDASDRFEKLKGGQIDVLCDTVTMRFSGERAESGTFSPIVFATGISYLQRRNRSTERSIYIGYVKDSTTTDILGELCRADLFGIVPPDQRAEIGTMCQTALIARRIDALSRTEIIRDGLIEEVKQAANREADLVRPRVMKAIGPQKNQFEVSLAMWERTIALIEDCRRRASRQRDSCTSETILKSLGDNCDKTKPELKSRSGDEQNEKSDNSGWRRPTYRFCSFDTYEEVIKWFCTPDNREIGMVYLGDREIILGKLQTWNERHPRCVVDSEDGAADLTYEPYAIMVAKPSAKTREKREKIAELVQRRVYEFFSFSALAREKFDTYFLGPKKDRRMSTALAYLFLLNGVEVDRRFTLPVEEPVMPRN